MPALMAGTETLAERQVLISGLGVELFIVCLTKDYQMIIIWSWPDHLVMLQNRKFHNRFDFVVLLYTYIPMPTSYPPDCIAMGLAIKTRRGLIMAEATPLKNSVDMHAGEKQPEAEKRSVLCRCPMCGAEHKMRMHWIGRGRPRKYCPLCRNTVKNVSGNVYLLDLKVH